MTDRLYTREEMVEAFKAGVNWTPDPPGTARTRSPEEHNRVFLEAVERYVDGLQDAPSGPATVPAHHDLPENRGQVASDQEWLHPALREQLLKINEREIALARIIGPMIVKMIMHEAKLDDRRHGHLIPDHAAFAEIWIETLNQYFPELTEGAQNTHPTIKPIALMRWLCRLVTPPKGTILDPFAGSGSTGVAAEAEGFRFMGIEREDAYAEIARQRLEGVA